MMLCLRLFALLPRSAVLAVGSFLGFLQYYLYPKGRWLALQNLKRAFPSWSLSQLQSAACTSFQYYVSAAFDVIWAFHHHHFFDKHVTFLEEKGIFSWLSEKKGIVFLFGHQAGWEFFFPALTRHFPGLLIAKPFNNGFLPLYKKLLLPFRERYMGGVIEPQDALSKCQKVLMRGQVIAVADHSYRRDSRYVYPLFGVPASTSLTPAVLAYKSNSPLVVCSFVRNKKGYTIRFSPLLFPDRTQPVNKGIRTLMDLAMSHLELGVQDRIETWAWMYNRWRLKRK